MKIMRHLSKGFTITEMMIVVVLLGIIAGLAIAGYQRAFVKSIERDAILQLKGLHAASQVYRVRTGGYLDTGGGDLGVDDIDILLGTNLMEPHTIFIYNGDAATGYFGFADYSTVEGEQVFEIRIDVENSITDPRAAVPNPCCVTSDDCSTIGNCI